MLESLYKAGLALVIVLTILSALYALNVYKEGKLIGANPSNVITVTGSGKVSSKPNMATINFTVRQNGKDADAMKEAVAKKVKAALDNIKGIVDDKDIKTESYYSNPVYAYPANSAPTITGYEVVQNNSIKVRKVEDVSKVLDAIAKAGINEVSGPSYSSDDNDSAKDEARAKAIEDAKAKAEKLADQLGVSLGRIVNFSESGNREPYPMYMMKAEATSAMGGDVMNTPQVNPGENDTTSEVAITYEIK